MDSLISNHTDLTVHLTKHPSLKILQMDTAVYLTIMINSQKLQIMIFDQISYDPKAMIFDWPTLENRRKGRGLGLVW